jgi:hypothetical protein
MRVWFGRGGEQQEIRQVEAGAVASFTETPRREHPAHDRAVEGDINL